jgi:hypothetical protein
MDDEIPDFGNEKTESPKVTAPPLPPLRRRPKQHPAKTSKKTPPGKRRPVNPLEAG